MRAKATWWRLFLLSVLAVAAAAVVLLAAPAQGQAVIGSGNLHLGIQQYGQLAVCSTNPALSPTGSVVSVDPCPTTGSGAIVSNNCGAAVVSLHYNPTGDEAQDCDFEGEGWGLTYDGGPVGFAYKWSSSLRPAGLPQNDCSVILPLPLGSFTSTLTTAVSTVQVGDILTTQTYEPHASRPNVYMDTIQLRNLNTTISHEDVLYRRVMSWGSAGQWHDWNHYTIDTLPAPGFPSSPLPSVVIKTGVVAASTCPNPLSNYGTGIALGPPMAPALVNSAYGDNAMVWDFNFGTLAPMETRSFTLYYGAAGSKTAAMADLAAIGAQAYNLATAATNGCTSPPPATCTGPLVSPVVWYMAFGNLGPQALPPPPPEPQANFLLGGAVTTCHSAVWHFQDASTPAGSFQSFTWDFGDASPPATGQQVQHLYAGEGTYTVTMTADTGAQQLTHIRIINVVFDRACPPWMEPLPFKVLFPGQTMTVCAIGHPGMGGPLTYDAHELPAGAVFDPSGPCITWTPSLEQVGFYTCIRFTLVEAPYGMTAMQCQAVRVLRPTETIQDQDQDGIADEADACPQTPDQRQVDSDHDGKGDACDETPVGEGAAPSDGAPGAPMPADTDADGVADWTDNCKGLANGGQADLDADAVGDACDIDADGDGVVERSIQGMKVPTDNCPLKVNRDQADVDGDGVGDVCQGSTPARMLTGDGADEGVGTPANTPLLRNNSAVAWMAGLAVVAAPAAILAVQLRRRRANRP